VPATVKVIAEDVISGRIVNCDLAKGISTFTHWRTTRSRVQADREQDGGSGA
jgi:hypothetical protein